MKIQGHSGSCAETRLWGAALGGVLSGAELILIHGGLGVGKTHFVQGVYSGLGGDPAEIVSPTFTLVNTHNLPSGLRLLHYDLYRLEAVCAGRVPEIDDELGEAIQAVEWAQYLDSRYGRLANAISVELVFSAAGDDERTIRINCTDADGRKMARQLERLGISALAR